jgi:hypothetical protein
MGKKVSKISSQSVSWTWWHASALLATPEAIGRRIAV